MSRFSFHDFFFVLLLKAAISLVILGVSAFPFVHGESREDLIVTSILLSCSKVLLKESKRQRQLFLNVVLRCHRISC